MNKPRILVTGGCGYIGSHTIVDLLQAGYNVVSLDNGINSSFEILDGIESITGIRIENINVDLSDTNETRMAIKHQLPFDGIIHFAALKSVEESVYQPLRYFKNNVGGTMTTIVLMEEMNIPYLIFSSSCTVYGAPDQLPVTETTPMKPAESPYGATKQAGENLYDQYFKRSHGKFGISLRYFNPAGAHPSAIIGEASAQKATNLVPVITETAYGIRPQMIVHGTDYATRDGSCIRDYIHIMDVAKAHTMAMDYLMNHKSQEPYEAYNLGIGQGVTVLEAIHSFEETTGVKVNYVLGPRRPGDVPAIYADHAYITRQLGWRPEHTINDIMRTAWEWENVRRSR